MRAYDELPLTGFHLEAKLIIKVHSTVASGEERFQMLATETLSADGTTAQSDDRPFL
jgi:hypothetical protein